MFWVHRPSCMDAYVPCFLLLSFFQTTHTQYRPISFSGTCTQPWSFGKVNSYMTENHWIVLSWNEIEVLSSSVKVSTPLSHAGKLLLRPLLHLMLLVLQFRAGVARGVWWRGRQRYGQGIGGPSLKHLLWRVHIFLKLLCRNCRTKAVHGHCCTWNVM